MVLLAVELRVRQEQAQWGNLVGGFNQGAQHRRTIVRARAGLLGEHYFLAIRIDHDEPLQLLAPEHGFSGAVPRAPDIEGADRAWGQPGRVERYSRCRFFVLIVARLG